MDFGTIVAQEQVEKNTVANQSAATLAKDFDNFLHLLTTQLQYQDPLAPMDSNQFTQQLVAFTGVEQSIATNKNLEEIVNQNNSTEATNAVGYLGKEITIETDKAGSKDDGTVTWLYTLGASTNSTKITVKDQNGYVIDTVNGALSAGTHDFVWQLPADEDPGVFSIEIEALSGNDEAVAHTVYSRGIVNSVDKIEGNILLASNGILVPPGSVLAVKEVKQQTIPAENGTN